MFIPTAANVEPGDKTWLIENLQELALLGFKSLDIADISAVGREVWMPKLEAADVIFFGGGSTYHLMEWINKSGLAADLPKLLETRVFAGLSAGSMVACKDLCLKISQLVYKEDLDKDEMPGLNFLGFYFLPHLNSEYYTGVREAEVREAAKGMPEKIYVLDDQSALKVVDGKVKVVSEGKWFEVN